jgi:hypothetical protein
MAIVKPTRNTRALDVIALIVALALSAVAAFYSVVGLTAIFAGSYWPVVIMGSILEIAKVITTSWLYQNWAIAPRFVKYYLVLAVTVLMFVTSIGIFGYLSKAHIENSSVGSINQVQVLQLETQIAYIEKDISSARATITSLDSIVQTLTDAERINGERGAIAVRSAQQPERDKLDAIISTKSNELTDLQKQKNELDLAKTTIEAEVGPLKYVAELVYGESDTSTVENAVRLVILTLIFVFDPLALLLMLAANAGIKSTVPVRKKPGPKLGSRRKSTKPPTDQTRSTKSTERVDLTYFMEDGVTPGKQY